MTEDALQRQIVTALQLGGARVLSTTRRPRRCWNCNRWQKSGQDDGVSRGVPDLLVWRPGWGLRLAGIEVKGQATLVRLEQQELADLGAITICRSVEEALAAVGLTGIETRGVRLP